MPSNGNATQINAQYLNNLKQQLATILTDVENQLKGQASPYPSITLWVPTVDSNLTVKAGGDKSGSSSTFDAGAAIEKALSTMGGSVHSQLTWLQKILNDMINEITTTVNSFGNAESLNNESVDKLIQDFQSTIGDFGSPPGGSPSPPPSTGSGA
jgi:hypothetical protein